MRRSLIKSILFRCAAVLIGLAPFFVAEGACRVLGWGRPADFDDPYVGFSDIQPLFVLNENEGRYQIPEARLKFFCPESFPATKPSNCFRIFVLGGSTVQGRPYQKETSFTTWLELNLRLAQPNRLWETINCGGISYASYRLVPILKEVLTYQPDLIIVCTGHNEFLEERTYGHIKDRSEVCAWPHRQVSQLRLFNLLRGGYLALTENHSADSANRPSLAPEVHARLDWRGGLQQYRRDDDWRKQVVRHFGFNLSRMTTMSARADVPLMFVCPVANLDWPPFKSEHRSDITDAEKQRITSLLQMVRDRKAIDHTEPMALLAEAARIDDRFALVHYEMGKRYLLSGQAGAAKSALLRAKDEDVCPLRMLTAMREVLLQIAKETGTPVVDAEAIFTARSGGGIPGARWLVDHVHPSIEGHQLLADRILQEMKRRGMVNTVANWQAAREAAFGKHLKQLPAGYYADGLERLKGLRRWAYGNVKFEKKR